MAAFDSLKSKVTGFKDKGKESLEALVAGQNLKEKDFLKEIKPKRRYFFHSDYFEIDDKYACVLAYTHPDIATDRFGAFWGINRIALRIPDGVQIVSFESVRRYSEGWINKYAQLSDEVVNSNIHENDKGGGGTRSKIANNQRQTELFEINKAIQGGCSYLGVTYKMLVKADTLELLDKTVESINDAYMDRFGSLTSGSFDACQRDELETLFSHPDNQIGKTFDFTSEEYAGSYNLVTNGLNDPCGEYVGTMTDDVNNAAILFDVNLYNHHIVIANDQYDSTPERNPISAYWASKVSQAALINNGRVVHFIFDGTQLDKLGPKFASITSRINMDKGDVNMFEIFGDPDVDDEFSLFSEQQMKISLMLEQVYHLTEDQRGVTLGTLKEILEAYYIDKKMWYKDAKNHKKLIRILGLPHNSYPELNVFVAYIEQAYVQENNKGKPDLQRLEALGILKTAFNEMLNVNGDLFDTKTNPNMDKVIQSRRCIYNFSDLYVRNKALAQAQFVNIVSYAIRRLKAGDIIIIHGAEYIDNRIKEFISTQFTAAHRRGARVCYVYDSIDESFKDNAFCKIDQADYTIYGPYTANQIDTYQKILNQAIPAVMRRNLTKKGLKRTYIRRSGANILFNMDLVLGIETAIGGFR